MNKFQQELNSIQPSDQLVADTMKKMHAENLKRRADNGDDKPKGKQGGTIFFRNQTWVGFAAVAACAAIAAGFLLYGRANENVEMVSLRADTAVFQANAANRGGEGAREIILSPDEFASRANFDFESRFPGFACVSAEAVDYQTESGDALGDYGVFAYQKDAIRLTLYVSTSDQTAPSALTQAAKTRLGSFEVQFGEGADNGAYYAAWVDRGTSFCLQAEGMTQRSFVDWMRKTFS